ncbi:hypothetical protein Pan216_13740 [Planctomycetes bacterium Pan216]|uniref:Helicase XPB/Ssl2 N-terminal domain-containing protein n=1 Tax=Kolteria novifilia TaxID=2527975 RepID=A0A518B0R3_9BACT|nr:hypothetical protein Pan216_13740 [Planctomycetes bacterium Pan216]
MIAAKSDDHRPWLQRYSSDLLERTAERAARFSRSKKAKESSDRLVQALASKRSVGKIIDELDEAAQEALAIFRRSPLIEWRWDHAMRLLGACSIRSPYRAVQSLLTDGLLWMRPSRPGEELTRFEVNDGLPIEALPVITLAAPLSESLPDQASPVKGLVGTEASGSWRAADGWEYPMRLALLWRLATRLPIRRTQQNILFKRDQERIGQNSLLEAPFVDTPEACDQLGMLTYALAVQGGMLDRFCDEQFPTESLADHWPADRNELLLKCLGDLIGVENWNELGEETPTGPFASEMASARFLVLYWLGSLPPEQGASVEQLASKLEQCHPPWTETGERIGPLRQEETRARLARKWIRKFVFGSLYQTGAVEILQTGDGEDLARLSPWGKRFLGEEVELPELPAFPGTLLAQPNHEVVVYRQGLSVELLRRLAVFCEPKTLGAALTYEISADSVYIGLEAGLSADTMIETLEQYGGREIPTGLSTSIRTWAERRERIRVFPRCSLYEFSSKSDLDDAVERGLEGTAITDRILLVAGDAGATLKNLRITSSRNYSVGSEPCVNVDADGITLHIDLAKSDLLLETELRRFADSVERESGEGPKTFRLTSKSLGRALDQGLSISFLEEWFRRRTGESPPPSAQLLFRCAARAEVEIKSLVVLRTDDEMLADGLLQHPATAACFQSRLGPKALVVEPEKSAELTGALEALGVDISGEGRLVRGGLPSDSESTA